MDVKNQMDKQGKKGKSVRKNKCKKKKICRILVKRTVKMTFMVFI